MSDGDIVQIPDRTLYADNNGQVILAQIQYFEDYAEQQQAKLDQALADLQAVVENYNPQTAAVDVPIPTLDGPSFPSTPTWGPLDLNTSWPDGPTPPVMMPYPDMDFEYVVPTPPTEISAEWNWDVSEYTSDMWSALYNKVHGDIVNGGTGLTESVHASIVAREQEARRINQNREYQSGLDAVGAQGFNLPSGQIASFQMEFQREMLLRDQDAVNNLEIKDFDMATENTRFAVTSGITLEQMLRATWEAANRMGLEAIIAANAYIVSVYEANIKLYLALWEGVKLDLEALKMQIDAIAARNESNTKVWLGAADVYKTEIQAIAAQNESLIDERQSEVDVYKTTVQAVAVQYEALVSEVEAQTKAAALEVEQAITNSRIDLEAYIGETSLAERVANAIAQIGSQSVASALQGINTSLSHGFSSGISTSEGWTHGESLGESHGYSEA